jgi:hypothetical protein
MKIKMGKDYVEQIGFFCMNIFFYRVITEDEFIRGCMADRVLYQMLTADTSDPDR